MRVYLGKRGIKLIIGTTDLLALYWFIYYHFFVVVVFCLPKCFSLAGGGAAQL